MRRELDRYYTPDRMMVDLQEHLSFPERTCEPCAGGGSIAKYLPPGCLTYDIDPTAGHTLADARTFQYPEVDMFITNPPFNCAFEILTNLRSQQPNADIVLLLRLSFLEPTVQRGAWLAENPPDRLIVTPRISFTGNGKTDSVTTAWMVWLGGYGPPGGIRIISKT